MLKKCKIVMLSTNEPSKIGNLVTYQKRNLAKVIKEGINPKDSTVQFWNLYIISDDEIKKGDYIYCTITNAIEIAKYNHDYLIRDWKKVIATTDTSLYIHQKETISLPERVFYLPQPSEQFIQKYIEEYNRGNIITDVLVEYELISNEEYFLNTINPDENVPYFDEDLKINPKYNTISIKKVKDSYTKEEVDRMLDEQASKTTAEMMEKFKDYKSREEIKSLLFKFTNHFDLKRNIEITLDMQSKWLEENL